MVRGNIILLAVATIAVAVSDVSAEETVVQSIDLPGASLNQTIIYSPSKKEYEAKRDDTLKRLQAGDQTAFVNPKDGPWMRVETTATIGIAYKGVGASEGREHLRQISAAEEALYRFEHSKKK